MLNINELEKKWLKYKIKSYFPHAMIIVGTIVIFILILLIVSQPDQLPAEKVEQNKPSFTEKNESEAVEVNTSKEVVSIVPNDIIKPLEVNNSIEPKKVEKLLISPSFSFIEQMKNETKIIEKKSSLVDKRTIPPKETEVVETVMQKPVVVQDTTEEPIIVEEEKSVINIKRENAQNDIQEVINRFNKNNSPALSLFVAKKYYEMGNYSMSYNYALKTNEIDNTIEASWIIFAKSLVKLNKKEQAVTTLKNYIEHSHSSRAKTLLDEIISGKMK